MKRTVLVCALLTVLILLCGCQKQTPEPKDPVSAYKSKGVYTDLGAEQLSWESLDKLTKKSADMTPDEARDAVVEFWYFVKTALWISDAQYDYYKPMEDGTKVYKRSLEPGKVYAGLPYVSNGTGSIYRLLEFMDQETGVVNVTPLGADPKTFGNMCSNGCFWAWARVMNSANYTWCTSAVQRNNCLPVGPYTYDPSLTKIVQIGYGTDEICQENGEQVMYESYAAMKRADGMDTMYEGNGHIFMCTKDPVVVRNEDGSINPKESFLCITEQGGIWDDQVSAAGISFRRQNSTDKKYTFASLYKGCYIPFTFGELLGTDPIEQTQASFSHKEETITEKQLFSGKVTTNYSISDVHAYVYDEAGNEVFRHMVCIRTPSTMETKFFRNGTTFTWGSLDDLDPKGDYTVKMDVQLGSGERPVIYEGKLVFAD